MTTIDLNVKGIAKNGPEMQAIGNNLQGNILKSHGRGHTAHIFFAFNGGQEMEAKAFLSDFAETRVFSATMQEADKPGNDSVFINIHITKDGYDFLGIDQVLIPQGLKSMKDVQAQLKDPAISNWDAPFQQTVHGMVLLAWGNSTDDVANQSNRKKLDDETSKIAGLLTANGLATVLVTEEGNGIKRQGTDDDIEHFGYVDGISQPKFFIEDQPVAPLHWDSMMPLNLILTEEVNSTEDNCLGSYFVFRKLEQNVKGFKAQEQLLADELGLLGDNRELAGALVVGRFENGMPATLSPVDENAVIAISGKEGKINDFRYNDIIDGDNGGARCPFHAHIRKSNPRGETVLLGATEEEEKGHMMARRGIIYGKRNAHPNKEAIEDMPTQGVGLLFMSYQSDLTNQFEFIQTNWVNNEGFSKGSTGLDGVIGQGQINRVQQYAKKYDDATSLQVCDAFGGFVTLKGGEYFFTPSIPFLKNLAQKPSA